VLTLSNGSATIPKLVTGATGTWIGTEGNNAVPSEPTTGQIKLVEKKYMVLVPISNDLRRNSSLETERVVRDDMIANTANAEDTAFLKGSGLSGQPKGIYNWVPAAGKANSAGTTLANTRTDIRTAKNRLGIQNAPNVRRAWFMHSRSGDYMGWELVDGNSNFAYPQMQQGQGANLGGATVNIDNNIAVTLGGSANASEIYYVEMSECFIGDSLELELELIENAVYADASGTLRSGVSRDESAIRLIRKTDFAMRHVESAFVLEAVTYGA
jgi:HK97 family phage major capsid protein